RPAHPHRSDHGPQRTAAAAPYLLRASPELHQLHHQGRPRRTQYHQTQRGGDGTAHQTILRTTWPAILTRSRPPPEDRPPRHPRRGTTASPPPRPTRPRTPTPR